MQQRRDHHPQPSGEVEILEYCAGDEYKSDKDHFRATATGESMSRETAKKCTFKRRSSFGSFHQCHDRNRHRQLRQQLQVQQRGRSDRDVQRPRSDRGGSATFRRHHRCERLTQKQDGNYVSYMAIELSGEELVSRYNQRLSQDERIRAEYNYEKFKETFEAEMAKQR